MFFTDLKVTLLENDPIEISEEAKEGLSKYFLQSVFWGNFKSQHGWKNLRFNVTVLLEDNSKPFSFECSVLIRTMAKIASLAYVPMGPDFINLQIPQDEYLAFLPLFSKALKPYLPKNTLCIRFDPPIDFDSPELRDIAAKTVNKIKGLKKTTVDIQPPDTVLLDITKTPEELLENMKSKWRYNIHLAEKKGVTVRKGTVNDIDVFYKLYKETSERDGIALHSKHYYESLLNLSDEWKNKQPKTEITLYIAEHEGASLASIITLFSETQAVYLYGASSNTKRNLMPAYLLQWTAINDAKKYGSPIYDFYGIPPTDDEHHPMHGLYRFKTGFGGKNTHRIGSIDVKLSFLYTFYVIFEKLRVFYHKKIKKLLAGRI